jgi:hypothetical protein
MQKTIFITVLCFMAVDLTSAAQAQSGFVKALFEKYHLLGTFAWDCNRPPGKDNLYFVHRLIDADHVQRDQMSGPTNRDNVIIVDKASLSPPSQITVAGTLDGRDFAGVWLLQESESPSGKILSIEDHPHNRLYKCSSEGRSLNLTFDENVNREGRTIREFNLPQADAKLCEKACIDDTQCTAWVYRKAEGRTDRQPHCWLRNSIALIQRGGKDNLTISGSVRPEAITAGNGLH